MSHHHHSFFHSFRKRVRHLTNGLSFRRDPTFVPNLVMCIGVVFVRRGLRNLIDLYFFADQELLSNILAIVVGVAIMYLPDNGYSELGGIDTKEEVEKDIAEEVVKLLDDKE